MNHSPDSRPAPGEAPLDPFAFTPVPLRARRDGWTAARQRAFVEALRACHRVVEACRRVGMSPKSAYRLYGRPDAASFRRAWQAALAEGPRIAAPAPPPVVAPWSLTGMMIALAGKESAPPSAPHLPAYAKPRA